MCERPESAEGTAHRQHSASEVEAQQQLGRTHTRPANGCLRPTLLAAFTLHPGLHLSQLSAFILLSLPLYIFSIFFLSIPEGPTSCLIFFLRRRREREREAERLNDSLALKLNIW